MSDLPPILDEQLADQTVLNNLPINVSELHLTANNPRILLDVNNEKLDRTMDEFGDMGGIVYNIQKGELVSGNQRTMKLRRNPQAQAIITQRYDEPTSAGTVAEGYIQDDNGERWKYREVQWDDLKHSKGVILGNQHAAENDNDLLAERYHDILELDSLALEDLFMNDNELSRIQDGYVDVEAVEIAEATKTPKEPSFTIAQLGGLLNAYKERFGNTNAISFLSWINETHQR